jgi:hypothetical protein
MGQLLDVPNDPGRCLGGYSTVKSEGTYDLFFGHIVGQIHHIIHGVITGLEGLSFLTTEDPSGEERHCS